MLFRNNPECSARACFRTQMHNFATRVRAHPREAFHTCDGGDTSTLEMATDTRWPQRGSRTISVLSIPGRTIGEQFVRQELVDYSANLRGLSKICRHLSPKCRHFAQDRLSELQALGREPPPIYPTQLVIEVHIRSQNVLSLGGNVLR